MALRHQGESTKHSQPGDILLVVHEFVARSPDELSLTKGDRIELVERDDDFGDGWYLGRHLQNGNTGLFPEVYTTAAPKTASTTSNKPTSQTVQTPLAPAASKFAPKPEVDEKTPAATEPKTLGYFSSDEAASTPLPPVSEPTSRNISAETPDAATLTSPEVTNVASRSPQQNSAVMNETLSVIDEHITNMNKPSRLDPNPTTGTGERRPSLVSHDSGSQYSNYNASQTYVAGEETDEEESGGFSEAEVSKWSPAKVAEYLESVGVERAHCDLFREEEFTGEVILQMEQSQIFMKEFDLGPIGRRMRTWQKIKGLQDEVKSNTLGSAGPGQGKPEPTRSTSFGSTPPLSGSTSPRPSAASVRQIGHRRHSSTERNATASLRSSAPVDRNARTKQSSFDRSWTMGGAAANAPAPTSAPMQSSRTLSSNHLQTVSADQGSSQASLNASGDIDKGYASGGETETSKLKNVLRKRDPSTDHVRSPSYSSEKRRSAGYFWQKRRNDSPTKPAESKEQDMVTQADGVRVVSEPIQANQNSPTVTRLEYDNDQRRSYRDSTSKMSPTENQRMSTTSETTQSSTRRGLRTISDAITGRERSLITSSDKALPSETSMTDSPDRTSSTASGMTPTNEYDDTTKSGFATTGIPGLTTSGTRRKSKKATSAYIQGLEKKSPREQMLGCDHSGWMKKKSSNLMTTWKPRFFILHGRRLSYYYSETDTEEKGLIDISNHRVLPADSDFITSMHAALTGANTASPTSPQSGTDPNTPITPYSDGPPSATTSAPSTNMSPTSLNSSGESAAPAQPFLFKLVPPRTGLSKGVNFTRPAVHYFSVPSREAGRKWMAALMKATIDRDESQVVITTYQQKTISLEQARARKERPPFLKGEEEDKDTNAGTQEAASVGGDSGVAENDSTLVSEGVVVNDRASLPALNTQVQSKDGPDAVQTPNSGLGIVGLDGSAGNDSANSANSAGTDRLKSSGVWS